MCWFQRSRGRSHSSRCCCGCMCWLSTPPAFYPQYCCPQTARFLLEKFVKSGPVTLRLSSTTFFSQLHPPLLQGLHRDGFRRFLETRICVALFNKDKKYLPLQPVISESIICMSSAMYITDCPADLRSERVNRRLIEKQVLG